MRILGYCAAVTLLLGACRDRERASAVVLDAVHPSLADSADARRAVEQYLDALSRRDYQRAAFLFAGEWRHTLPAIYGSAPDTLTLAGFLRDNCDRGFYVCRLRPGTVMISRFRKPDTLELTVSYLDSLGRPYSWGPCCGDSGPPSVEDQFFTVARDSGYAVLNLPLYIP